MSITEKYNFKVSANQFHQPVSSNYYDSSETVLLELFEKTCIQLKNLNKVHYSMIELGSNQCYYSLLFKHILGKDITTNIMVEPWEPNLRVGQNEFILNECAGIFYNNSIGTRWEAVDRLFETKPITLNQILNDQNMPYVDVLHCDIDGSEHHLLETSLSFFEEKRAKHLFLLTHGELPHNFCKNILEKLNYNITMDEPQACIGGDGVIIAES